MSNMQAQEVLDFWFSEKIEPLWFVKNEALDQEIIDKFSSLHHSAVIGDIDLWHEDANSILALIILIDQFSRNMFRDKPESFAYDKKALGYTKLAVNKDYDKQLTPLECSFLYMPLMHSESIEDQKLSVNLYDKSGREGNLKFAIAHKDIIEKYGRFPHRNEILGRESTPEEVEYLSQDGAGF